MDNDKKTPAGAPSSDTTSALFVSARKKQLEQQEAERLAKEKEEQRLAAEAEVQRLEREVEERRRKAAEDARRAEEEAKRVEAESAMRRQQAEEEARRVEQEAQTRKAIADEQARRIAQESQSKKAMAAAKPESILGGTRQQGASAPPQQPAAPNTPITGKPAGQGKPGGLLQNKKLLAIAGGGAVLVIVLIVVLIVTLGGNSGRGSIDPVTASPFDITGRYYYLDGEDYRDSFYFYSDGTMEFYLSTTDETTTHGYSVDGSTINVIGIVYGDDEYWLTIVSVSMLVDKYDDAYTTAAAPLTPSPSPPPPSPDLFEPAWDITGDYFYLNGEDDNDSLWFYSDGTMEIYYSSSGTTDTWDYGMDEGQVTVFGGLYSTEGPYIFTIIDGDTLVDVFDDSYIRSSGVSASYQNYNEPEEIDPQADFDEAYVLGSINMGVPYPDEIFYISQSSDDYLELATRDPNGGFMAVQVLASFDGSGGLWNEIVAPQINGYGESTIRTFFAPMGDYDIEEEYPFSVQSPAGTTFQYAAVVSCEFGGVPMRGIVRIALWQSLFAGRPTDVYNYYSMLIVVHEDVFDDYRELFGRIRDNLYDA